MLTSAEFFESFDDAGFLKPATWTPFGSSTVLTAKVRYRAPSTTVLDGALRTIDHEIQYVTDQLPGLNEGDAITVDGTPFKVRQRPERILDGTVSRAELVRTS
jgi:hypothetical protein